MLAVDEPIHHLPIHDPRSVLGMVRGLRRLAQRHRPDPAEPYSGWGGQSCVECSCPASRDGSDCYQSVSHPCPTLVDLASALGIHRDDPEGSTDSVTTCDPDGG